MSERSTTRSWWREAAGWWVGWVGGQLLFHAVDDPRGLWPLLGWRHLLSLTAAGAVFAMLMTWIMRRRREALRPLARRES